MIDNLSIRADHWNIPENRAPYSDFARSDAEWPYPIDKVERLLCGLDVLEIGPGRGRTYARLRDKVKSYSICDIAPATLAEPSFDGVRHRLLLEDYRTDFCYRFDAIHFWYVLHHIKKMELGDFFGFVVRHLGTGGFAVFNTPSMDTRPKSYDGDGIGTTWINTSMIRDVVNGFGMDLVFDVSNEMLVMRRPG